MKALMTTLPILAGIAFGSVGVFVRVFDDAGFNVFSVLAVRGIFSIIMVLLFMLLVDRSMLKVKVRDLPLLAAGGIVGMTLTNVFFTISAWNISLALTGVLLGLSPVYVVIISAFLFKEKATPRKIICMIMAIIGAFLVSGIMENGIGTLSILGLVTGLISGFFYGMSSIFTKLCMARGYNGITITFYALITMTITSSPFANWDVVVLYVAEAPAANLGFIVVSAFVCLAFPYLALNVSLRHLEAGKASILTSSEPIAAMIFGLIIYAETPSVYGVCGLIITVVALAVMTASKEEKL